MLETNLRPCSPPRAIDKIWFFVRRYVFISLKTKFRASVTQTHCNLQGMVLQPHGAGVCVLHMEESCEMRGSWLGGRVEEIVHDLISNISKNSFSKWTVLCIKFLICWSQTGSEFNRHCCLSLSAASSAMSTPFITGQLRSIPIYELAFYSSFSEIAEGVIW
jgi:hypothetical protein